MDIPHELKETLRQLLKLCQEFNCHPRLVGGLAVRGFARRKRFTHDIDLTINRQDLSSLIAILKRMGFDYQSQTRFSGVKASKRIDNVAVEIHISVDELWDMTSNETYIPSPATVEVLIDEEGDLLAPTVSVLDLLILKLMPLRQRDLGDVIALLLDIPDLEAQMFWANCERTGITEHIASQLSTLENALRSGDFREAWSNFYGQALPIREVYTVLEKVRALQKARP